MCSCQSSHADCVMMCKAAVSSSTLVRRCGIYIANYRDLAQWATAMTMHV